MTFEPPHTSKTEQTAQKIMSVAADELSPLRDPMRSSRDIEMPKMTTSLRDEMSQLNRNPAEMRAVIKEMEAHPKDGLNVKVNKDANGNPTSIDFEIPGTQHYPGREAGVNVLNEREEAVAQRLAKDFSNLPNSMSFNQLRDAANTMKFLKEDPKMADRIQTNIDYEMRAHNPKGGGIGYAFRNGKFDSIMAYGHPGAEKPAYLHINGEIDKKSPY